MGSASLVKHLEVASWNPSGIKGGGCRERLFLPLLEGQLGAWHYDRRQENLCSPAMIADMVLDCVMGHTY